MTGTHHAQPEFNASWSYLGRAKLEGRGMFAAALSGEMPALVIPQPMVEQPGRPDSQGLCEEPTPASLA